MLRAVFSLGVVAALASPARADDATKGAPEPRSERAGLSLALGWGGGALPENDDDMFSSGISYVLQAGLRLEPSLWLVFDNRVLAGARSDSDPARSRGQGAFTSGLKWAPYGVAGDDERKWVLDLRRFSLMAGAGLGVRSSSSHDRFFSPPDNDYGLAATGGVGWMPVGGRGWSLGLELTDSLVRAGGESRQHVVSDLLLTVQL
jgi:hypothetical protein